MNTKKFKQLYLQMLSVSLMAMCFFGCERYLDVDTDTDNPTIAPINQLLPNIEIAVSQFLDFNLWSGSVLSVYTHQSVSRNQPDQYGTRPDYIPVNNDWNQLYLTLTDVETLISQAEEQGATTYAGIGKLLKAYLMTTGVDFWGDIPFTEATKLTSGLVSPVFDDGEFIYQTALDLIAEAKLDLENPSGLAPSGDDLFYGGSTSKWIKFANTYKLKLYNQIRLSSLFSQSDLDVLIAENNFFSSNADDFQFTHTATVSPQDERNQLFQSAYGGQQVAFYLSPWFYEILMGMNPNIHTGNEDPRIPYYWANQLQDGQFPRDQADVVNMDPRADYWDTSTGFFTIRFGSIGPWRDGSVPNDATFPGIFPCGGRYDDNQGFARTVASGTGVAPRRILTYDEFLYIQAELMHLGLVPGDAADKLTEAMTASFAKVDQVVAGTGTTQSVPVLSGTEAVTTFIDGVGVEFAASNPEKQLEIIMTQKWVATFGDPMDQYNDYRRTGYPVLADPNSPNEYQLDNGDAFPLLDSETVLNNPYNLSIYWPTNELNLNQNAPAQKDPGTYNVFWDN